MPRHVRNWWIALDVEGRRSRIASGPPHAGGGFEAAIKSRDGGEVTKALEIEGRVLDGGRLRLRVYDSATGEVLVERWTVR